MANHDGSDQPRKLISIVDRLHRFSRRQTVTDHVEFCHFSLQLVVERVAGRVPQGQNHVVDLDLALRTRIDIQQSRSRARQGLHDRIRAQLQALAAHASVVRR